MISLDRKLESFQFMQFWQEADQLREILNPSEALPMANPEASFSHELHIDFCVLAQTCFPPSYVACMRLVTSLPSIGGLESIRPLLADPTSQSCIIMKQVLQCSLTPAAVCAVVGFYDAVRRYILHSLLNTFQQLPKTQLSQSLKADGATLDDLVSSRALVLTSYENVHCMQRCAQGCAIWLRLAVIWSSAGDRVYSGDLMDIGVCGPQISQKIASDGWMITADNVIRFPKKKKQVSQQQTASTRSQFDKLVPVLKLAA